MHYSFSPRANELLNEHTCWLRDLLEKISLEIAHRRSSQNVMAPDVAAAFQMLEKLLRQEGMAL